MGGEAWEALRGLAGLAAAWGQQEGAGGAWLLPGKASLQLETTNPW